MRLSQFGGLFSDFPNSNVKGPCPKVGSEIWAEGWTAPPSADSSLSFVSGVEASVLMPSLGLLAEVKGRPAELRFRSFEVGAAAACGSGEGVAGVSCRVRVLCIDAREGILLFFDVGLAATGCCG